MKNVLIGILSLALAIGAFLTRPTEGDFAAFARQHADAKKQGGPGRPRRAPSAATSLAQAEFKDCWLWVEIRVDGKTLVTGVFNHWWDKAGRMERA